MTTSVDSKVSIDEEAILSAVIDELSDLGLNGRQRLSPEEVILLIEDVCIDMRCRIVWLPEVIADLNQRSIWRRDTFGPGHADFSLDVLISTVEGALQKV
ncbi:MAG: hypothetical protein ABJA64_02540 [Candidatus Saccharibacteria bacterium]